MFLLLLIFQQSSLNPLISHRWITDLFNEEVAANRFVLNDWLTGVKAWMDITNASIPKAIAIWDDSTLYCLNANPSS
jgi:hypothetical protein